MTVYLFLKIFALVLLLSPLVLILIGTIVTYIPGGAGFLSDFFWSLLGEINIFQLASNMLQMGIGYENLATENFVNAFLGVMFGALGDAAILSCCVFAVKSSCVFFNRKYISTFTRPVWAMTTVGVLIGVALIKTKGLLAPLFQGILTLVVCVGLFLYGIFKMLGWRTSSRTYRERRDAVLIRLMGGIVGNMFAAMCAVMLITCLLEGPKYVRAGGSLLTWWFWSILSLVFLHVTDWIMKLLEPA